MQDESNAPKILQTGNEYRKSNLLISGKYKATIMENKLLAVSLSKIQNATEDEQGNLSVSMYVGDLSKIMQCSKKTLYNHLDKAARSLTGRTIGSSDPVNKKFEYYALIISAKYSDGVFTVKFNGDLREHILNLEKKYTTLNLGYTVRFKHNASLRLYEIFKSDQYKLKYHRQEMFYPADGYTMDFSLAELKLMLGVVNAENETVKRILLDGQTPNYEKAVESAPESEKMFSEWGEFKRYVLDKAIEEINKTDLNVSYETTRSGRGGRVVGITFTIIPKTSEEKKISPAEEVREQQKKDEFDLLDDVLRLLKGYDISVKDARSILVAADYDMSKVETAYDVMRTGKNIENPVAFMIAAIKNRYKSGQKAAGATSFHKMMQQDYDFEAIENSLLQ